MEKAQTTLYIGEGSSLTFGNHVLEADADKKGTLTVEGEVDLSRVLGFKNLANNTVASGVYVVMISDLDNLETKVLKIMLIR